MLYVFYFYVIGCYSVFRKQKEFLKHNKNILMMEVSYEEIDDDRCNIFRGVLCGM